MMCDGVEIILAVEETFDIRIPDEKCETFITPQNLADYIISTVELSDVEKCSSQSAFYMLRKELLKHLKCERNEIRPDTELLALAPHEKWHTFWMMMWRNLKLGKFNTPRMERPFWINQLIIWSSLLISVYVSHQLFMLKTIIIPIIGWLIVYLIFYKLTVRFEKLVPKDFKNTRDLVRIVKRSPKISWQKNDVFTVIREIILDQLGISEDQFRWDAGFIEDLGCD